MLSTPRPAEASVAERAVTTRTLPLSKALLCTLGPSSMSERVISELEEAGATRFRINMSHTEVEALPEIIRFVKSCTKVPICLDTEGAQIRTGVVRPGTTLTEGRRIRLVPGPAEGDATTLPLTPASIVGQLEPGALVSVDFDAVLLRIESAAPNGTIATVLTGGAVGSRKAVTAFPSPRLPSFSPKDLVAVRVARRSGIRDYALSFCESPEAILELREMVRHPAGIIAKIESRAGVSHLQEIALAADGLLIDRGDLSREVRLEAIPLLQKAIIRKANALRVPVYVATNLLESMVDRRVPTRAEVNDVINTVLDGADGLVLAAETAIGKYPVEAARMIGRLLKEYASSLDGYHVGDLVGVHPLAAGPPVRIARADH